MKRHRAKLHAVVMLGLNTGLRSIDLARVERANIAGDWLTLRTSNDTGKTPNGAANETKSNGIAGGFARQRDVTTSVELVGQEPRFHGENEGNRARSMRAVVALWICRMAA